MPVLETTKEYLTTNSTEIIALIGCITGTLSFLITVIHFWYERFRMRITFFEPECMFFQRLPEYKKYKTSLQSLVRICLVNQSSSPVTILDIYGKLGKNFLRFQKHDGDVHILVSTNNPASNLINSKEYKVFSMDRQVSLPLRLETYDAFEGYMFFPLFPDTDSSTIKVKFYIKTSRRKRPIKRICKLTIHKPIEYNN